MFIPENIALVHNCFSLPVLQQETSNQVFGPYYVEDEPHFWHYTAASASWRMLIGLDETLLFTSEIPGNGDSGKQQNAFEIARMSPPLHPPSDPNKGCEGEPFLFDGWRFCWMYFPELARWELAPRGRA